MKYSPPCVKYEIHTPTHTHKYTHTHAHAHTRSSRKLQEPTPPYGDVLGATQHKMPPWLFTSKRRTSRLCHGVSCDTVRFILRAHLHIVWQAALRGERVCTSMRAHIYTHACMHIYMHVRTGVRSQSHTNAHIFHT